MNSRKKQNTQCHYATVRWSALVLIQMIATTLCIVTSMTPVVSSDQSLWDVRQLLDRSRFSRQAPPPPLMSPLPPPPPPPPPQLNPNINQKLSMPTIPPNDRFVGNESYDATHSNVIENRRFVEAASSRCFSSTVVDNPMSLEPSFVLVTANSETRLQATASPESILKASFDPAKKTVIFVHGFTQSYPDTPWLRKTRALFEVNKRIDEFNVIFMDWGIASHGTYAQVAANASPMGSFLANFVMKLIDLGADRMSIHMVGHSLGSHIVGFAGKRIRPRIGRITALDPAGPCFGKLFSNSPQDRLAADDAYEVDAYHYDDDFLGLPGQHGQFDVYVNGGSSQPGCKGNINSMMDAILTVVFRRNRVLSESHTRSTEVAVAQLTASGCQEVAYECKDYATFVNGECGRCDDANNQCFLMGLSHQYNGPLSTPLRTSFPGKRLYITTSGDELFCLNHYQVLITFEPSTELAHLAKINKWKIQLDMFNDLQEHYNVSVTNMMTHNTFSYLFLTRLKPGRFLRATLQIRDYSNNQVPVQFGPSRGGGGADEPLVDLSSYSSKMRRPVQVYAIEMNFMSNVDPQVRRQLSSRLCPSPNRRTGDQLQQFAGHNNLIGDPSDDGWLHFAECTDSGHM